MRILVTRPLPDGQRTAEALRALGHDVLLAPLMQVKPAAADLAGAWCGVIVTSANAIRAVPAEQLRPLWALPLFAVGERSAEAARQAGFRTVHSARGDATDLLRLIAGEGAQQTAPYLYLAGSERAADIEGELMRLGIAASTKVVYVTVPASFPPDLIEALERGAIDIVLHFSRRSAENYIAGAVRAGLLAAALGPRQLCIAPNVAAALTEAGASAVEVASRPNEASLLALVRQGSA
jgi:uroporphyrinogen-III synthase